MKNKSDTIVIFLVPPKTVTGGGVISIFSLAKESREILGDNVYIATYPGEKSYKKNTDFENDEIVYEFDDVLKKAQLSGSVIIHLPEYSVEKIVFGFNNYRDELRKITNLQLNVLNQNIKMMPDAGTITSLFTFTPNVTQTTAHLRYTNQELADKYRIPTHLFSVRIDPSQYFHDTFEQKTDTVLFSPDPHPLRQKMIDAIRSETSYEVIELHGLTYEEYKKQISRAKFMVTFGEGMDGYFIESAFSDSVGFAVYNDDFFPNKDFLKLANVYPDDATLAKKLVADIVALGANKATFDAVSHATTKKLLTIYGEASFKQNVRRFYEKDYSFVPKKQIDIAFLTDILSQKDISIEKNQLEIKKLVKANDSIREDLRNMSQLRDSEVNYLKTTIDNLQTNINAIQHSTSWRLTAPLRFVVSIIKKK